MTEQKKVAVVAGSGNRRLFVEVSDVTIAATTRRGGGFEPAGTAESVLETFESLEQAIEDTCATIFAGVTRLARAATPSKVSAEVSFELGGEGTIWFVAKGNAKAAVKVTAEWDLTKKPIPHVVPDVTD